MNESTSASARLAAEQLFAGDRASQQLGMRLLEVGPGQASVTMTVRPDMTNGHGICHGGFIFTLADSAFAFACNSYGEPTVAAGASIEFLAPATLGAQLTAIARETWLGARTGLYDITVTEAGTRVIAHMRGRSHRMARASSQAVAKE